LPTAFPFNSVGSEIRLFSLNKYCWRDILLESVWGKIVSFFRFRTDPPQSFFLPPGEKETSSTEVIHD